MASGEQNPAHDNSTHAPVRDNWASTPDRGQQAPPNEALAPGATGSGSPSDRLKHDVETHAAHAISLQDIELDERQATGSRKRTAHPRKCLSKFASQNLHQAKHRSLATAIGLLQSTLHVNHDAQAAADVSPWLTRTGLQQKPRRGNLSFQAKEHNLCHVSSDISIQHNLIYPHHSQSRLRNLALKQNSETRFLLGRFCGSEIASGGQTKSRNCRLPPRHGRQSRFCKLGGNG